MQLCILAPYSQRNASVSKDMSVLVLRLVVGAEALLGRGCDIRMMPMNQSSF